MYLWDVGKYGKRGYVADYIYQTNKVSSFTEDVCDVEYNPFHERLVWQ